MPIFGSSSGMFALALRKVSGRPSINRLAYPIIQARLPPTSRCLTYTVQTPHSQTNSQAVTIYAPGKEGLSFDFIEEPLGLRGEHGFGHADLEFGQVVGRKGEYQIVKKLGYGMNSSTWMAVHKPYVQRFPYGTSRWTCSTSHA